MYVIGTAGHIDHGKSALVQVLTGIDPDRLGEEKARGMTIDLGFAWLTLPSGRQVSLVDVPGHERFIKNMLAGVGGIDQAWLVIAADEGVMPQTCEHLAILDLLDVRSGMVVLTKVDLVDDELIELVAAEARDLVAGTVLADAPVVATSAVSGLGLDDLRATVDRLLEGLPPSRDVGRPRLPVDRVFTMTGFGTVVTGTLIDGRLAAGQEVEVQPAGRRARIRGLQSHGVREEVALPGRRTAVNLTGVAKEELSRGDVITTPGWLRPTAVVDVSLRLIPKAPHGVRHNAQLTLHSLAAESEGQVRLLDRDLLEPGDEAYAQIKLDRRLPLVRGDAFILRSPDTTLGGGRILDTRPRRHRRRDAGQLVALADLARGTPEDVLLAALATAQPATGAALVERSGLDRGSASAALAALLAGGRVVAAAGGAVADADWLFTESGWGDWQEGIRRSVADYHVEHPTRLGMPKEELRSRLRSSGAALDRALPALVRLAVVEEIGPEVRLPGHAPRLTPAQREVADAFVAALEAHPHDPPTDAAPAPELLGLLAAEGRIVRVGEGVYFAAGAYQEMVEAITQELRERGTITLARVRDRFATSRKYAQALLEHLDQQRVTRRVGDERVLR